ncbi:MAG: crossover junction endodeoxyribonuclease RuvC [Desulfobulbaceae bacterium]|uniref:Crossover junction endodeoxyribonuclease RuvC n=1 Tax=Candidatus Desulfatifera sulfidica TaxID=2841691 RepID=A0A8J6NAN5_9BACT|nr:crossover junction endodeoxyribonuclease RuvC [Candidatus Desulfatifera sulfidica]
MRVLGIDPGSRVTGYGVIDVAPGQVVFVTCGTIRTQAKAPLSHRLNEIFDGINEVIQVQGPQVAAVEQVFMASNPNSALKLGQARGAAVVAVMQNDLQVHDYTAKQVKQAVAGYGQAEKAQIQHMVRVLLNLSAQPSNDAADALAVAICHANQFRF